jgi:methanogen extracellular protein (TIGR04279 family)
MGILPEKVINTSRSITAAMSCIRVLLLLMCLLSISVLIEIKPIEAQESIQPGINLESTYPLRMPHLSIGTNWTYPYAQIPVLKENQSINGSIFSGANVSAVKICVAPFSVSELLSSSQIMKSHKNCSGTSLALNQSKEANFRLPGMTEGLYTLSIFDLNSSRELSAMQLLITKENLSLQLPGNITAGEPLMVKANISGPNESNIFAAVMISAADYDNMSLSLTSNENGSGYNSTLKLADKVQQLPGLTGISSDLAMKLMYLLPSNSAAGMQESSESEVKLFLLTDAAWQKGDYILTCAAYSKKEGLLDLKQEKVTVM